MSGWTDFRDAVTGGLGAVFNWPLYSGLKAWDWVTDAIIPDFDQPDAPEVENRSPNYGWAGKNTTSSGAPVFVVLGAPRVYGALIYQGADSEVEDSSGSVDYVDPATEAEFLVAWGEGELSGLHDVVADEVLLRDLKRSSFRHYLGDGTQAADPRFTTLRRYEQLSAPGVWDHDTDGDPAPTYPDKTASFTPAGNDAVVWAHLRLQAAATVDNEPVAKTLTVATYFTPNGGGEITGKVFTVHLAASQYGYVDVELAIGEVSYVDSTYSLVFSHTANDWTAYGEGNYHNVATHYWWDPVNAEYVVNPASTTGLYYAAEDVVMRLFPGGVAHQVRVEVTGVTPTTAGGRTGGTASLVALVLEEKLRAQALRHTAYSALTLARQDLANAVPKLAARVASPAVPVWTGAAFETKFSNNPIWLLRALLTSSRYGAGMSTSQIHDGDSDTEWGGWRRAAAYCDELVSTLDTATGIVTLPVGGPVFTVRGSPTNGTYYQWVNGAPTGASATITMHTWFGGMTRATFGSVSGSPTHRPGDAWSTASTGYTNYLAAAAVRVFAGTQIIYTYTGITDTTADYTGYVLDDGTDQILILHHDREGSAFITDEQVSGSLDLAIKEQRFRCDLVLDKRQDAADWLRQILAVCRATWWEDAGALRVAIAESASAAGTLGPADMVEGSFECREASAADRPDAIRARYWDPDQSFQRREVTVGEPVDGGRIDDVEYPGVLNPRQAQRLAWTTYRLGTLLWRCQFTTPLSTIAYEPGDVLTVGHPLGGDGWGYDVSDPDAPVAVPVVATNLITDTDFSAWTAYLGATVTITQGQALSPYTASGATRIQTIGGTSVLKYYEGVGVAADGVVYAKALYVRNDHATDDLEIAVNGIGTNLTVAPGETARLATTGTGNGVNGNQIQFRAASVGGTIDCTAYDPRIGYPGKDMIVTAITDSGDGDTRTYQCREYAAAAYSDDPGYNLPDAVRATRPLPGAPPPAENLVLTYLGDNLATGAWDPQVQLEWTHPLPALVAGVRVYESTDNATWREVGYAGSEQRLRWLAPLNYNATLYAKAVPVSVTGVAGSLADATAASISADTRQLPDAGSLMLPAAGELFPFDANLYGSRGTAPSGTPVATIRPGEGKVGRAAVAVDEATTNLLGNPDGDTTIGWVGTGTLATATPYPAHPMAASTVLQSTATGSTCYTYQLLELTMSADHSLGCWVYVPSTTDAVVELVLYSVVGGSWVSQGAETVAARDQWVQVSLSAAADSSEATHMACLRMSSATVGDVVQLSHMQLEALAYPTSYVDGSRAAGVLRYPVTGLSVAAGTIACWVYFFGDDGPHAATVSGYSSVFDVANSTSKNRLLLRRTSLAATWLFYSADSASGSTVGSNFTPTAGWHHVVMTWDTLAGTFSSYVDGVVNDDAVSANLPDSFADSVGINIGTLANGSSPLNSRVDDLVVLREAATADQIRQWAQLEKPHTDPHAPALPWSLVADDDGTAPANNATENTGALADLDEVDTAEIAAAAVIETETVLVSDTALTTTSADIVNTHTVSGGVTAATAFDKVNIVVTAIADMSVTASALTSASLTVYGDIYHSTDGSAWSVLTAEVDVCTYWAPHTSNNVTPSQAIVMVVAYAPPSAGAKYYRFRARKLVGANLTTGNVTLKNPSLTATIMKKLS